MANLPTKLNLTPMSASLPLVDALSGLPSHAFLTWWNNVILAIESNVNQISNSLAAAEAAQTTANSAQTTATSASLAAEVAALVANGANDIAETAVQTITSTTGDLSVGGTQTAPTLTVNSAPKWDTARTLSFTGAAVGSNTVDGSANVAVALSLPITGAVSTTNATPTLIATIPIASNTTELLTMDIAARRTGGSSGSTGDAAGYRVQAVAKNIAGTVTIVGQTIVFSAADQMAWTVAAAVSTTNIVFNVTGAANNNVDWSLAGQTLAVA